jgi:protein O-mannosyl-transferase
MAGTGTEHAAAVPCPAPGGEGILRAAGAAGLARWLLNVRTIPFALAAVTVLVFSPALLNGFVHWDDNANLFENGSYRGLGWKQIRWMFTNTLMGHYIPVTWLTFGLDYTLWGMNPFGYHLTSTLIHAANAALFYLVALRLLGNGKSLTGSALRVAGVMAALFFALNPLRAESVAWATERRDVLSGFFFLFTVVMYLKAAEVEARRRRRLLAGSVICYALALLSKSIVMTLPLVLILLDIYPMGRLQWRWGVWRDVDARAVLLKEKLPYLALGLAGTITSYWAVASNNFLTPMEQYRWPARIAMAGYSLWFYVEKTVLPIGLSPLYELPAVVNPLEPRFLLPALGVIALSASLFALYRRWPAGLAVWVYYGLILGPVSGIVHAGHQLAHDRYSYLSCLGWALLFGAAVGNVARAAANGVVRPWLARTVAAMAVLWIVALATLTSFQVQIWRDSETLWRYAVDADPRCSLCQSGLGSSFARRKLFPLAKEKYELALALRPDLSWMHGNLGLALQSMGDFKAAMYHHEIALARGSNQPGFLSNMGSVLLDQKRYSEAMPYLERAHGINPKFVPALTNLGIALIETGQPQKALTHLLRALELSPDEPVVRFDLARAYLALGNYEAARKEYDMLLKLDPERARILEPSFSPVM